MALELTKDEFIALENEKFEKQTKARALSDGVSAQDKIILKKQQVDNVFKKQFDYYNEIIQCYDNERKSIDGQYPSNPVTETDLQNAASVTPTGRLCPTPPATDIIRLPEAFDNSTLSTTTDNELNYISKQNVITSLLTNGPRYNTGTQPTTTSTLHSTTQITPSSTQISFTTNSPSELPVFHVNDKFLLKDNSNQTLIHITQIISEQQPSNGSCTGGTPTGATSESVCLANGGTWNPSSNYQVTLAFSFLEGTQTTIQSNATIDKNWSGFQNSDRIAKFDYTNNYNSLMTLLITNLQSNINNRLAKLNVQKTNNSSNNDADKASNTISNIQSSIDFLTAYLVNTEIGSNDQSTTKGLTSLVQEASNRLSVANSRVSEIVSSYTTHSTNFFDKRYVLANNRANGSFGSIREIAIAQNTKTTMQSMAASLLQAVNSMNM
jgi:hypothetical protein